MNIITRFKERKAEKQAAAEVALEQRPSGVIKALSKARDTKIKIPVGKIITLIFLTVFSAIMLYPLLFMIMIGLFKYKELQVTTMGFLPIPKNPTFDNYALLFTFPSTNPQFGVYLSNSLIRVVYSVLTSVITTLICGYAFSKLKFRGSRKLLLFLILISMVPGALTLLPTFLLFHYTKMYDTWWVYLIGGPGINVMGTFVVKQFMDTLPESLEESARIDGAGTLRIIFQIIFPLSVPILAYIAIGAGIGAWNDWGTSYFFTQKDNLRMLPAVLTAESLGNQSALAVPNYPRMVALGMIITLPSLIIFMVFQKYIIEGIANTGIKG